MIIIWNTEKVESGALKSEFTITKGLKDSIGTVCFSPSQKYIAATCNDEDHRLVVYDLDQLKSIENNLTSK
jgi:WD40 repeat protein